MYESPTYAEVHLKSLVSVPDHLCNGMNLTLPTKRAFLPIFDVRQSLVYVEEAFAGAYRTIKRRQHRRVGGHGRRQSSRKGGWRRKGER